MYFLGENYDIRNNYQRKTLYSPKTRFRLMSVSCFILLCTFFSLVFFHTISVKIPCLYILTACTMYLIILYKNSLNKYEIGIFLFLFVQLLALAPQYDGISPDTTVPFLLSYRYGVSSRSFLGTLMDFLSNGAFVSKYLVWHFIFCSLIFFIFLIAVYLGFAISKNKDNNVKNFVLFLSLLCLTCFTSPSVYLLFSRSEVYALIFTLFVLAIIDKPYLKWVIPFFALFTLSIHLLSIFFFIPFIFSLLFYKLPEKKEYITLFIVSFTVIAVSFILYLIFRKQTFMFPNADAFVEHLKTKTDLYHPKHLIHMTFFRELQDHLSRWQGRIIRESGGFFKFAGTVSILINLPLVLSFVYFWIKCFLHEKQRYMKLFFILPVLLLFYQIPVFFMFFDFGRWMSMMIQIQFMLVFYLIYAENKTVLIVIDKIVPTINSNWYPIIIMCAIMLFLGPVAGVKPPERLEYIILGFLSLF